MQYLGGKSRIAKDLSRTMLNFSTRRQVYIEPFLGAGSIAAQMAPEFDAVFVYDASPDLVALWQALQEGWAPPETVTEEDYEAQRCAPVSALRGFIGYGCSFGGKWFGGYARDPQHGRNFARTARNLLLARNEVLRTAWFSAEDYRDVEIVPGSVVYCDPPYRAATKYSRLADFDSDEFWKYVDAWSEMATVFVSEYQAPSDWRSVWQGTPRVTLRVDSQSPRPTEHLWVKHN